MVGSVGVVCNHIDQLGDCFFRVLLSGACQQDRVFRKRWTLYPCSAKGHPGGGLYIRLRDIYFAGFQNGDFPNEPFDWILFSDPGGLLYF